MSIFLAGTADGFAFVVQDDRTVNTAGNGGESLGFRDNFPRYLAVAFDFCADRPFCTSQSVRVETRQEENGVPQDSEIISEFTVNDRTLFGELVDGEETTTDFQVTYLDDLKEVQVFVNGAQISFPEATVDLKAILVDTNTSFVGFTGSNSDSSVSQNLNALNLAINNLDIIQMNSGFKLVQSFENTQNLDFGQIAVIEFQIVDTCNQPLSNEAAIASGITAADIVAFIVDESGQFDPILPFGDIVQIGSLFRLTFQTIADFTTTYSVSIEVQGISVQKTPLEGAINASAPDESGIGTVGIILLIALIAVLVIVVIAIARGWNNYRKKLDEHGEDIEFGKTKEQIDIIETTIDYEVNPMIAPLDKLKERLKKNEQVIADMKRGQQNAVDSDFTVEQLQEENEQLRDEMKELKRQQQLEEAGNAVAPSGGGRKNYAGKDNKYAFGEEGA